jgi:hypothetical protein
VLASHCNDLVGHFCQRRRVCGGRLRAGMGAPRGALAAMPCRAYRPGRSL